MCKNKLHLSENDKRLLRALRIEAWVCPACTKPTLRIEGETA